jgi:hypothetical protein
MWIAQGEREQTEQSTVRVANSKFAGTPGNRKTRRKLDESAAGFLECSDLDAGEGP